MPFCAWVYLRITTSIVREWLNSHDDNKCITANGYTSIYVGTAVSCDDYSFKIFGKR